MKNFTDNLKAFAMFVLALFKSDNDENKITAGEFARAHAKKIFAVAAVFVMFLAVSRGTEEKFFGITPEEFMNRYNANIDRLVSDKNHAERLKIDGFEPVSAKGEKIGIAFHTRQKYLALEIALINPEEVTLSEQHVLMVHLDENDSSLAHFIDFKLMSAFAAYTIENKKNDPDGIAMTRTISNLFDQFGAGNQAPIVSRNGFSYGLRHGAGDFGKVIDDASLVFFMGRP